MSYEKQTWNNGDIISAEKLNHIEDGIESSGTGSGNVFIVNCTNDKDHTEYVLDKTWEQIHEAMNSGLAVFIFDKWNEQESITSTQVVKIFVIPKGQSSSDELYRVITNSSNPDQITFDAYFRDGFPVAYYGD